jgi:hypothetical protein
MRRSKLRIAVRTCSNTFSPGLRSSGVSGNAIKLPPSILTSTCASSHSLQERHRAGRFALNGHLKNGSSSLAVHNLISASTRLLSAGAGQHRDLWRWQNDRSHIDSCVNVGIGGLIIVFSSNSAVPLGAAAEVVSVNHNICVSSGCPRRM